MVIFSSAATYLIFAGSNFSSIVLYLLIGGGMLITFAANALNQAIERDYDKLMERTAGRPLAAGRMSLSTAILIAGICMVLGIIFLVTISPLCATLGMLSLVLYAFIYTPVKRFSTLAVPIGAIPGALPTLIAAVAAQQTITVEALCFFGIQYLWQFPHFWAIAFLGHKDYIQAGFKLIKDIDGQPDPRFGIYSAVYSLLGILFLFPLFKILSIHPLIFIFLIASMLVFAFYGWQLFKRNDRMAARKLMLYSIMYLPVIFILFIISNYMR
ncbi:MAG: protoheme IX farnesyltransferase [Saprospiraceae bacterium]|nr:protoheme IX farnesyltransferase [Saprospiraceae bacterium]